MIRWWILGHLLWLSVEDIREGQISMALVAELGVSGLIHALSMGSAVAWLPGVLLLGVGHISREGIGYGDGWLLLALGTWMPFRELLRLLGLGFLLCVIYGAVAGKKEIPFVPFLTVVYVTGGWT